MLLDNYGRNINYLRLSVTDLCNFRCCYCMPSGGVHKLRHDQVLSLEEILRVARLAVGLGVSKIRITGGEPLLRRNLAELLAGLDALEPKPDLRITTNGYYLAKKLKTLKANNVSTINVSLDTLQPDKFDRITGHHNGTGQSSLHRVLDGIDKAIEDGSFTVKINVVLMGGLNDDELVDFARLTMDKPIAVRFIEYMPVGRQTSYQTARFVPAAEVIEKVMTLGALEELPHRQADGPATRYRLEGARGELGIISAVSSHFCGTCNRLRLSAEGQLVPCLFSSKGFDLKPLLRGDADDQAVSDAILNAALAKPKGHHHDPTHLDTTGQQMSRLGG